MRIVDTGLFKDIEKIICKKLLVCVLVATTMMSTIAMANENLKSYIDKELLDYLEIDENNNDLNEACMNVNKSDVNNNLAINVRQILADRHTMYILIDVEGPNDLVIPENAQFDMMNIDLKRPAGAGWGMSDLKDDDPNDNKKSYIISYTTKGELYRNDITLGFRNFGYYSDETDRFVTLIEGKWEISHTLDYEDISNEIKLNRFVKTKNKIYFIKNISISPISVSVNLLGLNHGDGNFRIEEIKLNDGTCYTSDDLISSNSSSSLLNAFTSVEFRKVIDVDKVESITIDGTVIKLKNK